jgi:1,4-alpha-glucan branching enzyme
VHLKLSLYGKMPGDDWQRLANLRLLYAWQWSFPGKKLLFMGGEFAQTGEWQEGESLPWSLLGLPAAAGIQRLIRDLNELQQRCTALAHWDCDSRGFEWLDGSNREQSILAFLRVAPQDSVIVILNFTPIIRHDYRVGVPGPGNYAEILNSDLKRYGGSNVSNPQTIPSEAIPWHGREHSIVVTLPPLAGILLGTVTLD